eukprot:SAG31_NODE_724_length_12555_cov_11.624277_11_plen_281_part_00
MSVPASPSGLFVQNFAYGNGGVYRTNVRNFINQNNEGLSISRKHVSSTFFYSDHLTMTEAMFDNCGAPAEHDTTAISEGGAMIFLPFATVRLERIHYVNNRAKLGGAISMTAGSGAAVIRSCTFIGNVAFNSGGAIAFKNTGANLVVETMFIGNQVVTSAFPPSLLTVRTFTGESARTYGPDGSPAENRDRVVWFVGPACDPCSDDQKPMMIDGSVEHMVGRLTPVFGNESYFRDSLYTEILSLPPGRHRLYHGVLAASNQPVLGWYVKHLFHQLLFLTR